MLQALKAEGIRPDLLVGTSAGAINAGWLAGRGGDADLDDLERIWLGLRREDIFPISPRGSLSAILGRRNHLVENGGLVRLLRRELGYGRLEDAALPVHVVATNLLTGQAVVLSKGDSVQALLASTALPGIFPPVATEAGHLVDGGLLSNTPISHAVDLGADRIYVLPSGYACALESPPGNPLGVALHALTLSLQRQLISDVERYSPFVELLVVPPLCPLDVAPVDFSRSKELIARARRSTRRWLRAGPVRSDPTEQLRLHEHPTTRVGGTPQPADPAGVAGRN